MASAAAAVVLALCFLCLLGSSAALTEKAVAPNYHAFEPQLDVRHHVYDGQGPFVSQRGNTQATAIKLLQELCGSLTTWKVTDAYTTNHNGISHVYLRQTVDGIEIANSNANVNFDRDGRILNAGEACFNKSSTIDKHALLKPLDAVLALASHLELSNLIDKQRISLERKDAGFVVRNSGITIEGEEIPIDQMLVQSGDRLILTWHLVLKLQNNWFDAHVCVKSGAVVYLVDWVKWDSYEVYDIPNENPLLGPRTVRVNPADQQASPKGWLDQGISTSTVFTTSVGNNVYTQLNPTGGPGWIYNYRPSGGVNKTFINPVDFFSQPYEYRDAALTNLFYWNNIIHDIFYLRGFNEAAGNFQENNFNKGGKGDDAVQANAQDGSGFNNANFATPPDGQRPRMRMYLWNQVTPMIDGDLDSGIIVHEYGHGISIRLTGGPSNVNCLSSGQPGGMGEGWGDFWATLFLQKKEYKPSDAFPMGNYAAGRGIRPFPYSADFAIDPQTFDYINRPGYNLLSNVHAKGSVWCTILMEVYWEVVEKHGFDADWYRGTGGNNALLQNVVDGLKLQPCSPNFVQARDAIILAEKQNYGGVHVCDMWRAFARRGLGFSAKAAVTPVVEAFDIPPECKLN